MYLIHKYWARKSHNVVSSYIQKYSKPGDTIMDPFCGSGVTIAEGILAHRNVIGIDVNPFSIFLSRATLTPVDIERLNHYYYRIHDIVLSKIGDFFGIKCPYCNGNAIIHQILWKNLQQNFDQPPLEEIQEIRIDCPRCELKNHILNSIEFSHVYAQECKRVENINSHYNELIAKYGVKIPEIPLKYTDGKKFKQIRHYLIQQPFAQHLFTRRNLLVLGILLNSINQVLPVFSHEKELICIRNLILLTFSANLGQSSKMVWVISKRKSALQKKKEVGSWTHHFFWNPTDFFEINPFLGYQTRMQKTIRAQKNLHNRINQNEVEKIYTFENWNQFHQSNAKNKTLLVEGSSERLIIPNESVDYIFTDPPYGESIQYYELSTLWNHWLGFPTYNHVKNEIVINPRQKKSQNTYFRKLEMVFKECARVLKRDGYMTLTFHNTDSEIRNGLIKSVINAGFFLDSLLFQMPARNSLKSYLHYEKSPVGDYFLRFRKHTTSSHIEVPVYSTKKTAILIENIIIEVLKQRGEPTGISLIYNCIDEELANLHLFPLENSSIVNQIIEKLVNTQKISINSKSKVELLNPNEYIHPSLSKKISEFLFPFIHSIKSTNSALYNRVYGQFNGWNTPDRKELTELIAEIRSLHSIS